MTNSTLNNGAEWADLWREALLVDHLCANRRPGLLVEFVDGGADGAELGSRHAAHAHHGVKDAAVVELDGKGADIKLR